VAATVLHRPIWLQVRKNHARVKDRDFRYQINQASVWSDRSLLTTRKQHSEDGGQQAVTNELCNQNQYFYDAFRSCLPIIYEVPKTPAKPVTSASRLRHHNGETNPCGEKRTANTDGKHKLLIHRPPPRIASLTSIGANHPASCRCWSQQALKRAMVREQLRQQIGLRTDGIAPVRA
jgi:hypothetical protein